MKDWAGARALFAEGPIEVDMSSLVGGEPIKITADQLIAGFQVGLHADKVSHHLAANYRIGVTGDRAEVWAHGYAWNRVPALPPGADLWETWGNYRLSFRRVAGQWRLDAFRYFSKHTRETMPCAPTPGRARNARGYRSTARPTVSPNFTGEAHNRRTGERR